MRLLALALLVAGLAASAQAQGLGAAAAREKQKRQKQGPASAPAFDNRDLSTGKRGGDPAAGQEAEPAVETPGETPGAAAPGTTAPGTTAPGTTAPGTTAPGAAPGDQLERERHQRTLLEADWRVRFASTRERLRLAEAASWHDVVRTEFRAGVPVPMTIKEQIVTDDLREARRALVELEEAFRRTGLPAGWARER